MKPFPSPTMTAVPVFPLPEYHLFPGTVAPLHIFETRYRQMINDLMDGPGRLVMASYKTDGPRIAGGPALPPVGTLAEIVQTEEMADGRWLILLLAITRVELKEVSSDRLYRRADATVITEPDVTGAAADLLRGRLVTALQERTTGDWAEKPAAAPIGRLADVLLHALNLEPERRERAYNEGDPVARAAMALAWHDLARVAEDATEESGTDPAPDAE